MVEKLSDNEQILQVVRDNKLIARFQLEVEDSSLQVSLLHCSSHSEFPFAMEELIRYSKGKNVEYIDFHIVERDIYKEDMFGYPFIENNWELEISQHIFLLDAIKIINHSLFNRNLLDQSFIVDSVTSLKSREIDEIKYGQNISYPSRYNPLQYKSVAKNSLILRHNNELIGWCIVVAGGKDILMYDNLFVTKPYWNLARSVSLFYESVMKQCELTSHRYLTFVVDGSNDSLLRVLKRRIKDTLVDYQEIKVYRIYINEKENVRNNT